MKICSQCQTEHDDTKKFCRFDGSQLTIQATEEAPLAAAVKNCSQCGKPVTPGKQFCRHCGASIAPKTPSKRELLEQQLAEDPTRTTVLTELAEEYRKEGQGRQAVELLENAVAQQNDDPHLSLALGQTLEAVGEDERALDIYLAAFIRHMENEEVEAALFRTDFLLKTYPRSVEALSRVAPDRENGQLWLVLAQVAEAKQEPHKAIAFLTEVINLQPNNCAALESVAHLYEQLHQPEEAQRWHERILAVNPSSQVSNLFFAQKHYAQGAYQDAIMYFERLLAVEQTNRLYQLYWLLAHVKAHGIQGYESGIAELLDRQDFTPEEQPLVSELFLLTGQEKLSQEDRTGAEQYLLQAHQLAPSQEVATLLGVIEEQKGDEAHEHNDFKQALSSYQRAATYDPSNHSYTQKVEQLTRLREEQIRQRRQAIQQKVIRGGKVGLAAILVITVGIIAYRSIRDEEQTVRDSDQDVLSQKESSPASVETPSQPTDSPEPKNSAPVTSLAESSSVEHSEEFGAPVPDSSAGSETLTQPLVPSAEEPQQGQVVTAAELGLAVSGQGRDDPNRSPPVLQQEIESRLASLQEAYEAERAADPSLMGSLVLSFSISSDGETADIGFQSTKIASQKLQDLVRGLAHEWHFPSASHSVQVVYPLLFLPPELEPASIIAWEKTTAALAPQLNTTEATPPPSVAKKKTPPPQPAAKAAPKRQALKVPLGMYRVVNRTQLWSGPRSNSTVVTQLRPGIRLRVVRAVGNYLEVRSRRGKPPGFVHKNDVVYVRSR